MVQKWSGDPPGGPEVVGGPSWKSVSGWETLMEVSKCLGDPPGGPEVVGGPTWRFLSGRRTLPEVR